MNKKYFNIVQNEDTEYEYRFKTKDEFIDVFGVNWRVIVECTFIDPMDHLLGLDFPYHFNSELYDGSTYTFIPNCPVDGWSVSFDMLIKNKNKVNINNYFNNKNVYESKEQDNNVVYYNNILKTNTIYPYRFKTIDEMKKEYLLYEKSINPESKITMENINDSWRYHILDTFVETMDKFSGVDYEIEDITIDTERKYRINDSYKSFYISSQMLTKNSVSPLYNMVKKKNMNIYENKIFTLNEYLNEIDNAYSICIYIDSVENLAELNKIILEIDNSNKNLSFHYSNKVPLYIFYDIITKSITWVPKDENLHNRNIEEISYMEGVYNKIFNFNSDKYNIIDIIKNKKIRIHTPPLYNMVKKKNMNIYEDKISTLNEYLNEIDNAYAICIDIKELEDLSEINNIINEIDGQDHRLLNAYKEEVPFYLFYDLKRKTISWIEYSDIEGRNIEDIFYLTGVYSKVFDFKTEKDEIINIIKNKKISHKPYYLKTPRLLYESVNNKPSFFKQTYYRLPNSEELKEINSYILKPEEILNGLTYSIVGRGVLGSSNKELVLKSINLLIDLDENNQIYRDVLLLAETKFL